MRDIPPLLQLFCSGMCCCRACRRRANRCPLRRGRVPVQPGHQGAGGCIGDPAHSAGRLPGFMLGRHRRCSVLWARVATAAAGRHRGDARKTWPADGPRCWLSACRCWCGRRSARRSRPNMPALHGFNFVGGATVLARNTVRLLIGLTIYTSAYIAEIVRSGIQAVSAGPVGGGGARSACRRGSGAAAGGAAAGDAGDHPAADQRVPEPDQEQLAGGGDRLPGHRSRWPTPR